MNHTPVKTNSPDDPGERGTAVANPRRVRLLGGQRPTSLPTRGSEGQD